MYLCINKEKREAVTTQILSFQHPRAKEMGETFPYFSIISLKFSRLYFIYSSFLFILIIFSREK